MVTFVQQVHLPVLFRLQISRLTHSISNPLNVLFSFLRKVWSYPWSAKSPEPNSWAFCTNNARLNSHPAASHRAALSPICKRVEFAFQLPRAKELPLSPSIHV